MRSECRAFSEEDLDSAVRESFTSANMKLNEYLYRYRRVDPEDAVSRAVGRRNAPRYPPRLARCIVSVATPITANDSADRCATSRILVFGVEYARGGGMNGPEIDPLLWERAF